MPYRLFHSSPYDADTVELMTRIFDQVCIELGLANREDKLRDYVAFEILECIGTGERNPQALLTCIRTALRIPKS